MGLKVGSHGEGVIYSVSDKGYFQVRTDKGLRITLWDVWDGLSNFEIGTKMSFYVTEIKFGTCYSDHYKKLTNNTNEKTNQDERNYNVIEKDNGTKQTAKKANNGTIDLVLFDKDSRHLLVLGKGDIYSPIVNIEQDIKVRRWGTMNGMRYILMKDFTGNITEKLFRESKKTISGEYPSAVLDSVLEFASKDSYTHPEKYRLQSIINVKLNGRR